jgi:signal transduction histidine kinase
MARQITTVIHHLRQAHRRQLEETQVATRLQRILVGAVRSYSYLDQAPRQTVDVHEGLESTLALLAHKLRAKHVEIVRELDPRLPGIEASGSELNQVWTNLIDNAIAAMGDTGTLTVRTFKEGSLLVVEIRDTGVGIPVEVKDRIFEPFFTTKAVGQGTGLGLDITWRIVVNKHHGDVRVESKPGDTRFQIRLPLDTTGTTGAV